VHVRRAASAFFLTLITRDTALPPPDLVQRGHSPVLEKILSRLADVTFGVDRPRVPPLWCPPCSPISTAAAAQLLLHQALQRLTHITPRPSTQWKPIVQTLQQTVPSSASLSQALQSLAPTPTPASKFLLSLATSRNDPPPHSGAVAHAACSVLLRAWRAVPPAAAAVVVLLCVASLPLLLLQVHPPLPSPPLLRQGPTAERLHPTPPRRSDAASPKAPTSPGGAADHSVVAPAIHALQVRRSLRHSRSCDPSPPRSLADPLRCRCLWMRCARWTTTRCSWWRAASFPTSRPGGACVRRVC